MIPIEVQLLFWKEVRQLTRNTAAMLSSLFMPAVLIVLAPVLALLASRTGPYRDIRVPAAATTLPGFDLVHDGEGYFLYVTLPFLFVIAALLTPILAGIHTLIVERERRSLELLMALPVLVGDILAAKLAAILATAVATIVPMFAVDAIVIVSLTGAGMAYVIGALFLIVSTLVAAVSGSLLMALMARDLRSATSLGGMLSVPPLLLTGLCVVFIPGLGRFVVLGLLMALMARDLRSATSLGGMLAVPPLLLTGLCVVFIPGLGRFVVLGLLMLGLGCATLYGGLRWLTWERYVA